MERGELRHFILSVGHGVNKQLLHIKLELWKCFNKSIKAKKKPDLDAWRLRVLEPWCAQHLSLEPSCLPSSGGGVMGIFSWQTLGHSIPTVVVVKTQQPVECPSIPSKLCRHRVILTLIIVNLVNLSLDTMLSSSSLYL